MSENALKARVMTSTEAVVIYTSNDSSIVPSVIDHLKSSQNSKFNLGDSRKRLRFVASPAHTYRQDGFVNPDGSFELRDGYDLGEKSAESFGLNESQLNEVCVFDFMSDGSASKIIMMRANPADSNKVFRALVKD